MTDSEDPSVKNDRLIECLRHRAERKKRVGSEKAQRKQGLKRKHMRMKEGGTKERRQKGGKMKKKKDNTSKENKAKGREAPGVRGHHAIS